MCLWKNKLEIKLDAIGSFLSVVLPHCLLQMQGWKSTQKFEQPCLQQRPQAHLYHVCAFERLGPERS